jgi:hypothetical protein
VVQEFSNAPDATFHIGNFSLDWTLVSALIAAWAVGQKEQRVSGGQVLSGFKYKATPINMASDLLFARLVTQSEKSTEISSVSEKSLGEIGFTFMTLLRGQVNRQCSDLRDKVYPILSMTDASLSKASLPTIRNR